MTKLCGLNLPSYEIIFKPGLAPREKILYPKDFEYLIEKTDSLKKNILKISSFEKELSSIKNDIKKNSLILEPGKPNKTKITGFSILTVFLIAAFILNTLICISSIFPFPISIILNANISFRTLSLFILLAGLLIGIIAGLGLILAIITSYCQITWETSGKFKQSASYKKTLKKTLQDLKYEKSFIKNKIIKLQEKNDKNLTCMQKFFKTKGNVAIIQKIPKTDYTLCEQPNYETLNPLPSFKITLPETMQDIPLSAKKIQTILQTIQHIRKLCLKITKLKNRIENLPKTSPFFLQEINTTKQKILQLEKFFKVHKKIAVINIIAITALSLIIATCFISSVSSLVLYCFFNYPTHYLMKISISSILTYIILTPFLCFVIINYKNYLKKHSVPQKTAALKILKKKPHLKIFHKKAVLKKKLSAKIDKTKNRIEREVQDIKNYFQQKNIQVNERYLSSYLL